MRGRSTGGLAGCVPELIALDIATARVTDAGGIVTVLSEPVDVARF